MKTINKSQSIIRTAIASFALLAASSVFAGYDNANTQKTMSDEDSHYFSNGWREGKIETAIIFNQHLSAFDIDVEVNSDTAYLIGTVSTEIEKDLAGQVALSVDGINNVKNQLRVSNDAKETSTKKTVKKNQDDSFLAAVKDASISAQVKMKLLANEHVAGLKIDVDTVNKVVTLKGEVPTKAAKNLAGKITENTDDVSSVNNKLNVVNS